MKKILSAFAVALAFSATSTVAMNPMGAEGPGAATEKRSITGLKALNARDHKTTPAEVTAIDRTLNGETYGVSTTTAATGIEAGQAITALGQLVFSKGPNYDWLNHYVQAFRNSTALAKYALDDTPANAMNKRQLAEHFYLLYATARLIQEYAYAPYRFIAPLSPVVLSSLVTPDIEAFTTIAGSADVPLINLQAMYTSLINRKVVPGTLKAPFYLDVTVDDDFGLMKEFHIRKESEVPKATATAGSGAGVTDYLVNVISRVDDSKVVFDDISARHLFEADPGKDISFATYAIDPKFLDYDRTWGFRGALTRANKHLNRILFPMRVTHTFADGQSMTVLYGFSRDIARVKDFGAAMRNTHLIPLVKYPVIDADKHADPATQLANTKRRVAAVKAMETSLEQLLINWGMVPYLKQIPDTYKSFMEQPDWYAGDDAEARATRGFVNDFFINFFRLSNLAGETMLNATGVVLRRVTEGAAALDVRVPGFPASSRGLLFKSRRAGLTLPVVEPVIADGALNFKPVNVAIDGYLTHSVKNNFELRLRSYGLGDRLLPATSAAHRAVAPQKFMGQASFAGGAGSAYQRAGVTGDILFVVRSNPDYSKTAGIADEVYTQFDSRFFTNVALYLYTHKDKMVRQVSNGLPSPSIVSLANVVAVTLGGKVFDPTEK